MKWISFLWVGIGGAAGACLRVSLALLVQRSMKSFFPWGTLSVNWIGCLLVGILFVLVNTKWKQGSLNYLLIGGFCGGFTTFSAFALELFLLIRNQGIKVASFYLLLSFVGGVLLLWLGLWLGLALKSRLP